MSVPDAPQWQRLSPLMDELLDLTGAARAARLAALRHQDPAVADELQALLAPLDDDEVPADFLEGMAWPSQSEHTGHRVGAYELERELGQGGMGSVWLAHRTDGRYEGQVAIKFLHTGLLGRGDAARFAREGSILARLDHPHIARLLDAGVTPEDSQPYLVLEYIQGLPLDAHCREQQLGLTARLRLFLDVLDAVSHAHNQLVLHRDLKPSNILVTPEGRVKLLDFGIAKLLDETQPSANSELTAVGGRAYTLHYAAPEQVQGGEVSTATDVYALGVLLYQLLGGRHPTAGNTTTELDTMRALVETEPQRLSDHVLRQGGQDAARQARALRGDLDTLVAKALKKAPAERYANAAALADDLRRHLQHEPLAAQPDTLAYRSAKFLRRHRVGVALGTAVALGLGSAAAVAMHQARQAQQQREQAEGLIEFMLGDLRQKLQAVGRLDVLDAVGDKALAHYAAEDLASLDASALGRRARALHLMGEIAEQRGQPAEAAQRFKEAAASTAALLARNPQDPQRLFDHAQSAYWLGYIAYQRGQWAEAEAGFGRYLVLARQLTAQDPGNPAWRTEEASATLNLGVLYKDLRRYDDALRQLATARRIFEAEAAGQPALYAELANVLGWVATTQEAQGQYEAAIATQAAKLTALGRQPGADTDRAVQQSRATAHQLTARLWLNLGQLDPAADEQAQAVQLANTLATADPSNLDWRYIQATALLDAADLAWRRRQAAQAGPLWREAQAAAQALLAGETPNVKWRVNLPGRMLVLQAREAQAAQVPEVARALAAYRAAWARPPAGLELSQTLTLAEAALAHGDLLAHTRDTAAAQQAWQQSVNLLQALGEGGGPAAFTLQAHAQQRLGHTAQAQALAARVEASHYRHPHYLTLRLQLAQGGPTSLPPR